MREVFKAIGRAAATDAAVLIVGESGTGKELVAAALHRHSDRAAGPFVRVNCGALPEGLIESELFGHERGAFTGADRQKPGRFERAAGGTIFLDEVGELPQSAQAKILRVLQQREFERVGGTETLHTDARVISATHRDLAREVAAGRFREDLYYRLNVARIAIPPLRDRPEDIPPLAEHILRRVERRHGWGELSLSPEALRAIQAATLAGQRPATGEHPVRAPCSSRGAGRSCPNTSKSTSRPTRHSPPPRTPPSPSRSAPCWPRSSVGRSIAPCWPAGAIAPRPPSGSASAAASSSTRSASMIFTCKRGGDPSARATRFGSG